MFLQYRFKARRLGELLKPFLIFVCLSWGSLCGLSRITDKRHHWQDVLFGAVLGVAGAIYTVIFGVNKFNVPAENDKDPAQVQLEPIVSVDQQNKCTRSVVI